MTAISLSPCADSGVQWRHSEGMLENAWECSRMLRPALGFAVSSQRLAAVPGRLCTSRRLLDPGMAPVLAVSCGHQGRAGTKLQFPAVMGLSSDGLRKSSSAPR